MVFEDKARQVVLKAKGLDDGQEAVVDPATVLTVVSLIKELIGLYKSCHRPASMTAANMQAPGLVARRRLKKLIGEKTLPENFTTKQLFDAVLEVGKTVTETDVVEMYSAA